VIEDDVEVGANVTIDRGRFGATRIGTGVKIDNLVHIAHNVQVDEHAMILAQVGVAGSTRVGKRALLAGQAGIAGHLTIHDGGRVGGGSAVFRDVPSGEDYFGNPAGPKSQKLRQESRMRKLDELVREVRELRSLLRAKEEAGE